MHQGSHFGKNKPDWQMTHAPVQSFNLKYSLKVKLLFLGLITQGLILFPIIYWSIQNYIFFENNIPASYNLKGYINTEKQWVLFLYGISVIFSACFNLYLVSKVNQKSEYQTSDLEISPVEAVDQRRVS